MSITLILILVCIAICGISALVIYILARSASSAAAERDAFKAQCDRYLREIAACRGELDKRQKLLDEIMEADRESDLRREKIEKAPGPVGRFDATMGILHDIAGRTSGASPASKS